jgi:DNA-binding winged helix-turn-helix (wHTH) protein/TolB-like protein/Flp pilus assembly protein TadD
MSCGARFRFGAFELDCDSRELRKSGLRIHLEDQPLRLLSALVVRHGEVLTREELHTLLWSHDTYVDFERGLTRTINKVRVALGDSAASPRFVETLPRRGYRFIAPVEELASAKQPASHAIPTASPAGASKVEDYDREPALEPVPSPPRSLRRRWIAVFVFILTTAAAATVLITRTWRRSEVWIAVLPFKAVAGGDEQRYLADHIASQLTSELSRIRSFKVLSRQSVNRYRDRIRPLSDIARELKVETLVDGSVTQSGRRVRLSARLLQLAGEQPIWEKTYQRDISEAPALQAELARDITDQTRVVLTHAERQRLANRTSPVAPELHQQYLKGRFLALEPGRDSIEHGIQLLEAVVGKDPGHAPAHAALAEAWFQLSSFHLPPVVAMPKAKAAARKAIGLNPEWADARATLGRIHVFYDWDWQAAEEQLLKALELNPNSSSAYRGLGCLRMAAGRTNEALDASERGLRLDPMSLWVRFDHVWLLTVGGRYDEATDQARRNLEWEPTFGLQRALLGVVHGEKRNFEEAIRELEAAVKAQRIPTSVAFLAHVYALAGRRREAEQVLAELVTAAGNQYICPYEVASAYASLGRMDDAFAWMNRGVAVRADCMVWLRVEPWLVTLRRDARYAGLERQVGFP